MPLRSVEAATRDDAIAAAREQFGPSARVVGVRRVRSGGVLGFFATERYVAEVAPDPGARPPVPSGPPSTPSPLASAAPATARTTAPARNGAAAYAAAASPSAEPVRAAEPAPRTPQAADEARLSELVGLLAAEGRPAEPAYGRPAFPRAAVVRSARSLHDQDDLGDLGHRVPDQVDDEHEDDVPAAPVTPSPFTAALARMVSGDRDVRQAVEEALEQPVAPAVPSPPTPVGPWPAWSGPVRAAEPAVPSPPARQKEETVGDQVIAPPSKPEVRSAEVPTWAAEPAAAPAPDSSREEAIAEVLRSALAQGHSDEALAGILRKVLAGASPQTALTEPHLALPNLVAALDADDAAEHAREAAVDTSVGIPVATPVAAERPVVDLPAPDLPVAEPPVVDVPPVLAPVFEPPAVHVPATELAPRQPDWAPAVTDARVELFGPAPMSAPTWYDLASQSSLWADTTPDPLRADAPIWADVVRGESATTGADREPWSLFGSAPEEAAPVAWESQVDPVVPEAAEDIDGDDIVAEDVEDVEAVVPEAAEDDEVEDDSEAVLPESVAEPAAEDASAKTVAATADLEEPLLEFGPLLVRTASDPAPVGPDTTTVMPPLSLLPPLPGTRGRGRPPVPPARLPLARPTVGPAATSAPTTPAEPPRTLDAPALTAPSLATVTRLPVGPAEAPELPESADPADAAETSVECPVESPAVDAVAETVVEAVTESVAEPRNEAPAGPGDVLSRLETLGLSAEWLGDGFAEQVAVHGVYAALTRTLGLRLPPAPEVPTGAGEVLFVVGPGIEALRAARSLAVKLRLDPEQVQWATRGDLVALVPVASRVATTDAAVDRRQAAAGAGTVTIVAVDAPLRTDAYWMAQMLSIWSPVAVWAVVEATRKPEDLEPWLAGLSRVDALIVQDTDLSADPAAVLRRAAAPVALLDGVRATPHRWASLLCERLEGTRS